MDRTGQTLLGKYELTRLLGKGGMGEVWEGEHQLTGRRVAVKVLSDNYLSNRKVVARFGREARAASSVHHEGIVEILDQDKTQDGVPFLVMEFLDGESVGARIKRRVRLSQSEALAIMLPLLEALDAAHQAGVVHRDLKPDNVFILPSARGGNERIKILDFGISRKADEIDHHLTQEGAVLGTPHYMSPEQARGESGVDARADVYSAAVLLYECVVGDVPFDAGNYNALLQIILTKPPQTPRTRGAAISQALEQVLMATLHKDKNKRPVSARAFRDVLAAANEAPEDAELDPDTWTFHRAGPPEPMNLTFTLEAPTSGVRRAPEHEGMSPRESGEFDFETPVGPSVPATSRMPSPPPVPTVAEPLRVPPPPDPVFARPLPAPRPSPPAAPAPAPVVAVARAPLPDMVVREPLPSVVRAPARPEFGGRPGGSPARQQQDTGGTEADYEGRSGGGRLGRAIGGWILVLVAIAALGYVASLVFNRPDPRKTRRPQETLGQHP
ncbi:MAG: serine/threonine-protein kinase [Myxococcales bacterium]